MGRKAAVWPALALSLLRPAGAVQIDRAEPVLPSVTILAPAAVPSMPLSPLLLSAPQSLPTAATPVLGQLAQTQPEIELSPQPQAPQPAALPQAEPALKAGIAGFEALLADLPGLSPEEQARRVDDFVAAQSDTLEGFPLRRGREVVFLSRSEDGAGSVAGSWNNWNPSDLRMRPIGGTKMLMARAVLPAAARYEYKLVSAGGAWSQDALNRKFAYDHGNSVVNLAGSGQSHLERYPAVHAEKLGNDREVVVYLPAGALDSSRRYPVLYMHDGQNLFDPAAPHGGWGVDRTLDGLIAQGAVEKVIVVGAANTPARMQEYAEVPIPAGGPAPLAVEHGDFLVRQLKPFIDGRYPTQPGRGRTAVIGSSLGGRISLWLGATYPHIFGLVGAMSPTVELGAGDKDARLLTLVSAGVRPGQRFYLDSGGAGRLQPKQDNWAGTRRLRRLLANLGFVPGRDLLYQWAQGARHDEEAWLKRMEEALRFFFPARGRV
jgi:enterochelin esterase-like enzyme